MQFLGGWIFLFNSRRINYYGVYNSTEANLLKSLFRLTGATQKVVNVRIEIRTFHLCSTHSVYTWHFASVFYSIIWSVKLILFDNFLLLFLFLCLYFINTIYFAWLLNLFWHMNETHPTFFRVFLFHLVSSVQCQPNASQ